MKNNGNVFDYVYGFVTVNGNTGIVRADSFEDAKDRVLDMTGSEVERIICMSDYDNDYGVVLFKKEMKKKIRQIKLEDQDVRPTDAIWVDKQRKVLNFSWETWFDVDKYFGTNIENTDEYVSFYTEWHADTDDITAYYEIEYEEYKWELTDSEKEFLRKKMCNYCGGSMREYYEENPSCC